MQGTVLECGRFPYITEGIILKQETKNIITFILLAYIFIWAVFCVKKLLGGEADFLFGVMSAIGPAIAAFIVASKTIGAKAFLKYSFTFEQNVSYYIVFLLFAVWRFFLCMFVGERVPGSSLLLPILLIPICIFTGGMEEFGWRGYLQPQLEKRMHSVHATLIIVFVWAFWHIPLWFVPGATGKTSLIDFFIFLGFTLTNSFSLAAIYKITNSVLLCVLFHAWSNAITNTFMPTGDIKTIAGFAFEGVVSIVILVLCEKGVIKSAKVRLRSCTPRFGSGS